MTLSCTRIKMLVKGDPDPSRGIFTDKSGAQREAEQSAGPHPP